MTIAGSGYGNSTGAQQTPFTREIDTTAWTEVNKASLGIVKDTFKQTVPFTENILYHAGYMGGFGYKSTASDPLLDHPLDSLTLSVENQNSAKKEFANAYEQLAKKLPQETYERLLNEKNLPLGDRSPPFIALDNTLNFFTNILMTEVTASSEIESLNAPSATYLAPLIQNLEKILTSAQESLFEGGANTPNFDNLNNAMNQLKSITQTLQASYEQ